MPVWGIVLFGIVFAIAFALSIGQIAYVINRRGFENRIHSCYRGMPGETVYQIMSRYGCEVSGFNSMFKSNNKTTSKCVSLSSIAAEKRRNTSGEIKQTNNSQQMSKSKYCNKKITCSIGYLVNFYSVTFYFDENGLLIDKSVSYREIKQRPY